MKEIGQILRGCSRDGVEADSWNFVLKGTAGQPPAWALAALSTVVVSCTNMDLTWSTRNPL